MKRNLNQQRVLKFANAINFALCNITPPSPLGAVQNKMRIGAKKIASLHVAIFLAVQGFNLLGDGLRDALDPRHD